MKSAERREAGVQTPRKGGPSEKLVPKCIPQAGKGSSYTNRGVIQGDRTARVRAQGGKGSGMVQGQREAQGGQSKGSEVGWCPGAGSRGCQVAVGEPEVCGKSRGKPPARFRQRRCTMVKMYLKRRSHYRRGPSAQDGPSALEITGADVRGQQRRQRAQRNGQTRPVFWRRSCRDSLTEQMRGF